MEDVVKNLVNNAEFVSKVADEVEKRVTIKELKEINEKISYLITNVSQLVDSMKLVWEKFEDYDKKFNIILEQIYRNQEDIKRLNERLDKHEEEIKKLNERLDKNEEKLDKMIQNLGKHEEEIKKLNERLDKNEEKLDKMIQNLGKHEEEIKKLNERLDKNEEKLDKMIKKLDQDYKTIARVVGNTEEEALDYLTWKFKNEFGKDVELYRLDIPHVTEIDIYGEFEDYVIIGETKERGSISAYNELARHVKKLQKIKPEINNKKLILIIYALAPSKDLIDQCRKEGIYLTSGFRDYSQLKLT
ncbi:coiled-coil domain-containing protein [Acidianus brierleyi]|uniref:DUF8196 domain-containing protein n=1 Tax=Acidianus brierleyi TaxID=41673 RepID=A0A2U9IHM3_9CREN|nr:hypothetical protein [Acidianus brierleyi]AWR95542.1 hypothetical protein DFR85_14045 [Acidianus brierleyi]